MSMSLCAKAVHTSFTHSSDIHVRIFILKKRPVMFTYLVSKIEALYDFVQPHKTQHKNTTKIVTIVLSLGLVWKSLPLLLFFFGHHLTFYKEIQSLKLTIFEGSAFRLTVKLF